MGWGKEFIREMGLAYPGQKFEKNECTESLHLGFSAEYSSTARLMPEILDQTVIDVVKKLSNDGQIEGYCSLTSLRKYSNFL